MKDKHRWQQGLKRAQRNNIGTFAGGEISRLLNSTHFFLECVYIKVDEKGFRLVVLNKNRTEMDKAFNTLRGARIAFCKRFKPKAWGESVLPEWSTFYNPESYWINEKNQIVLRAQPSCA